MVERFKYGNITDTGSASTVNEDYYGCFDTANGKVFVLCDGMSNPIGGHVASKAAVEAIREYYNLTVYNNLIISLQNALSYANNAVLGKIQTEPELAGMHTGCLIVIVKDNRIFHANLGSSRLYHFRGGKCMLISGGSAESVSGTSVEISSENYGEQILGNIGLAQPNICNEPLIPLPGDLCLLCSSGLTHLLVENFSTTIVYNGQELQMRVADLVKLADQNQTADNTTLQLIEFDSDKKNNTHVILDSPETVITKHVIAKSTKRPVVLPVILVLLIAAVIYFGSRNIKTDEETAVAVSTETKIVSDEKNEKPIAVNKSEESLLATAQYESEKNIEKFRPQGNHPQLPPVNPGGFTESGSSQIIETQLPSPVRISSGSGEAYVYTLQSGDNAITLKNKFGKSWEQLKNEDPNYSETVPQPGKDIKIYGYIFFASGSESERNENIENALKSSPGLKRSQIIIVPDGILIP